MNTKTLIVLWLLASMAGCSGCEKRWNSSKVERWEDFTSQTDIGWVQNTAADHCPTWVEKVKLKITPIKSGCFYISVSNGQWAKISVVDVPTTPKSEEYQFEGVITHIDVIWSDGKNIERTRIKME